MSTINLAMALIFFSSFTFAETKKVDKSEEECEENKNQNVSKIVKELENKPCGLKGALAEKIKDCGSVSKGDFVLVSRLDSDREIFQDKITGNIWSYQLPNEYSGYDIVKACASLDENGNQKENNTKVWRVPSNDDWREAAGHDIYRNIIKDELERKKKKNIKVKDEDAFHWTSSLDVRSMDPSTAGCVSFGYRVSCNDPKYTNRNRLHPVKCIRRP